jgi:hypothetical protein
MGPARTVIRRIVEKNHLSRSSLGACAHALEAELYAKLSKLPKLYMVTPRDRQDNGGAERGGALEKLGLRRVGRRLRAEIFPRKSGGNSDQ